MNGQIQLLLSYDLTSREPAYAVRLETADSGVLPHDGTLCAISPLFAVSKDAVIPTREDCYSITFVVHESAFVQVGKLTEEQRRFLWVSLGIAGLVFIIPEGQKTDVVGALDSDAVLCRETWTIKKGKFAAAPNVEIFSSRAKAITDQLVVPAINDSDFKRVAEELRLNFDALRKRSRVLMPPMLAAADQMSSSIVREIQIVADQINSSIDDHNGPSSGDYFSRHKRLNLSIDAVIQLNSALAYILSQSFYGGPPLTRNLSLISCHSLLGIGTAMKALHGLTQFVMEGFAEHPIAHAVKSQYSLVTVGRFLNGDNRSNSGGFTVDDLLKGTGRLPQTPKLAYFSTRMGFSEQGYCVTASTQSLASASTARRNMLTMTHELLHAHVKGLLATILSAGLENSEDVSLLVPAREHRSSAEEFGKNPHNASEWSISKFLRFRMFTFADAAMPLAAEYPNCVVDDQGAKTILPAPVHDDHFEIERFKSSFGFLTELVVHVLDLHYFYDASPRIYLATLWKSWVTVPGVADKLEWYILRCLAAISVINLNGMTKECFPGLSNYPAEPEKSVDEQFSEALAILADVIDELIENDSAAPMLRVVADKIENAGIKQWLRIMFFPCYSFSQVVKQFLYSPALRNYFDSFRDPLADRDANNEPIYRLDVFEFPSQPIRNPIALLRALLRREMDDGREFDETAASAWLFLALSSVPIPA